MLNDKGPEAFLIRNRISSEDWEKCKCKWSDLQAIAEDHEKHRDALREAAELFARVIQKFDQVHSVRWRVKDTEHLLEKIVRKRAENNEKYAEISAANYFNIVTDLVGLRALHLFKDDCLAIDTNLRNTWETLEPPIAYVRAGDAEEIVKRLMQHGFETKEHPAGYRSVHYVLASQPLQRRVVVEVQVRTIFEEGWSEIDHRVRYPNFSDNELVDYFLTIFNRMAGSADEMGGFVRDLAGTLRDFQDKVDEANRDRENTLQAMETTLGELERLKQQDVAAQKTVGRLKDELEKLKKSSNIDDLFGATLPRNALASLRPSEVRNSLLNALSKEVLARSPLPENALARLAREKPKGKS